MWEPSSSSSTGSPPIQLTFSMNSGFRFSRFMMSTRSNGTSIFFSARYMCTRRGFGAPG